MIFRVWLHGSSMTASYNGYVDVNANDINDAKDKALTKLTCANGTFSDWSKDMFRVDKVETLKEREIYYG